MMLSALLVFCEGNPPVTSEFPHKGSVMWSFSVSFAISLNKLFEQIIKLLVMWDGMALMESHGNYTNASLPV